MSETLWTADDIADFIQVKKNTVFKYYVCKPEFPAAIKLPSGGRRWVPEEVKKFITSNRQS